MWLHNKMMIGLWVAKVTYHFMHTSFFFYMFSHTFHVLRKEKCKEAISHLVKNILAVPSTQTQVVTRNLVRRA